MSIGGPLQGIRVCILTDTSVEYEARVRNEARTLALQGADVVVVGLDGGAQLALDAEPFRVIKVPRALRCGQPDISWAIRVSCNVGASILARLSERIGLEWTHPRFYNRAMVAAAVAEAPDVVHANDVFTAKAAMEVVEITGAKLVMDIRECFKGYFPEEWHSAGVLQRTSDKLEAQSMAFADGVATVSPSIQEHLASTYGRLDAIVLYNSPENHVNEAADVATPVRMVNQGSMRESTGEHLIIEAMEYLRDIAVLTVQGRFADPAYKQQIETIIAEKCLSDVVTLEGPYDPNQAVEISSSHDVGVLVWGRKTPNYMTTLPNRLFTYMAAGLAVVAHDSPAHRALPGIERFAMLADATTPEALAAQLRPLLTDPGRLNRMKVEATALSPSFSWSVQGDKLVELYRSVLGMVDAAPSGSATDSSSSA